MQDFLVEHFADFQKLYSILQSQIEDISHYPCVTKSQVKKLLEDDLEIDCAEFNFDKVMDEASPNGLYYRGQFLTIFINMA